MKIFPIVILCFFGAVFAVIGIFILADPATGHSDRDTGGTSPTVIMGLSFFSIGVTVVLLGLRQFVVGRRVRDHQQRSPDKPWLWNDDWRDGKIQYNARTRAIAMWFFSLLWNGIVAMAIVLGGPDLARQASEDPAFYLFLLFPLVGIGVVIFAVRTTLQWRRYGTSTLVLRDMPVRIGGHLDATVQLPPDVRGASEFKVRVACTRTTRRGKNTTTTVLWSDERTYPAMSLGVGPTGPTLSIRQDIPAEAEQSSVGSPNPSVDWKVEISAEVEGVDFQAEYNIPVFPR